jgi:hypothetical protein
MITRSRLPRYLVPRTVRVRLTMLYSSLFLASAVALLCMTDVLWGRASNAGPKVAGPFSLILSNLAPPRGISLKNAHGREWSVTAVPGPRFVTTADPKQQRLVAGQLHFVALQQQTSDLHHLLVYSAIALGVMVMIAIVLGWFMAGRFLRPVRAITAAANDISATNLHERLRLTGPTDELKELGDTFDRLLERLEVSFESQRQFVANASHELRTPLTTMRASLDVAVGKPGPIPEETVVLAGRIRSELDQVDRLLESFLALARAERGLGVDDVELSLDELASAALERHAGAISSRELEVARVGELEVPVRGSETLLSRMVDNLVDNAIKHNEPGGWIRVTTQADGGIALLVVENGGPVIEDKSVEVLTQPFRRLGAQRTGSDSGTGLGLSIVASVAEAHGGTLALHALGNGGLQVVVELPLVAPVLAGVTA